MIKVPVTAAPRAARPSIPDEYLLMAAAEMHRMGRLPTGDVSIPDEDIKGATKGDRFRKKLDAPKTQPEIDVPSGGTPSFGGIRG